MVGADSPLPRRRLHHAARLLEQLGRGSCGKDGNDLGRQIEDLHALNDQRILRLPQRLDDQIPLLLRDVNAVGRRRHRQRCRNALWQCG